MGYKYKPNKSVAKRFRVSGTGKLKRGGGKRSHLQSSRSAKTRRQLRKPDVLHEGHARNMRLMMGISGKRPNKLIHDRKLAAAIEAKEPSNRLAGKDIKSKSAPRKPAAKAAPVAAVATTPAPKAATKAAAKPATKPAAKK